MNNPIRIPQRKLGVALIIVAVFLAAACSGGSSDNTTANAIASINAIDGSGFHEIDESIQNGTIPPTGQSIATHLQTVLLLTTWPNELKAPATKLAALFGTLASQLNTDKPNLANVQQSSANAHAGWHQFSSLVWTYLGDKAGVKNGAVPTPSH